MKQLVEVIAKALVDNPDEVVVHERVVGKKTMIQIQVSTEDKGQIIGKQGRVAKAIRSVVKATAISENKYVNIEII